ncbi:hypothetical protein ALTERO38_51278 [Alteromonas sp. 38]|nr:hypothetical protein ALTER154_70461 [Alteromonas sp. 154]VXB67238.1 hypothetical protein ALTERO38_51278 [Alteromonas sp. 38]
MFSSCLVPIRRRDTQHGLIIRSDKEVKYPAQELIASIRVIYSMRQRSNRWDDAVLE